MMKNLYDKYIKDNSDLLLFLKLVLIVGGVIILFNTINVVPSHTPKASLAMDSVRFYKDKLGNLRSEIQIQELDKEEFKRVTDSFRRELKGRNKIKEVIKYVLVGDTTLSDKPISYDTSSGDFSFSHHDNYLLLQGYGNTKTGLGNFDFMLNTTVTTIVTEKRHLFRANEKIVDIKVDNDYIKVTKGGAVVLKEPKEVLSVSLQVGFNPFTAKPYAGIGVSKSIFTIKTRK